jgi:hypothetical protein
VYTGGGTKELAATGGEIAELRTGGVETDAGGGMVAVCMYVADVDATGATGILAPTPAGTGMCVALGMTLAGGGICGAGWRW